jgi:hypothetical protein
MFDRNDPTHLTRLKALVVNPNDGTKEILDFLNGETATIGISPMTAEALLSVIYPVAISSQDQFKIQLLFEGAESMQSDLSRFRQNVRDLGSPIAIAIDLIVRNLTAAEVEFSELDSNGVHEIIHISESDWFAARDS